MELFRDTRAPPRFHTKFGLAKAEINFDTLVSIRNRYRQSSDLFRPSRVIRGVARGIYTKEWEEYVSLVWFCRDVVSALYRLPALYRVPSLSTIDRMLSCAHLPHK